MICPISGRFSLGQVLATPGAIGALHAAQQCSTGFLNRHLSSNWGDVCAVDQQANDDALLNGERLLSAYRTKLGTKIWIITEADRSATTILLPEEY